MQISGADAPVLGSGVSPPCTAWVASRQFLRASDELEEALAGKNAASVAAAGREPKGNTARILAIISDFAERQQALLDFWKLCEQTQQALQVTPAQWSRQAQT